MICPNCKQENEDDRPLEINMSKERLRKFIQEYLKGRCEILSIGEDCKCPLCDFDNILRQLFWYGKEAEAIAKNFNDKNESALSASVHVLMLDGGRRAGETSKEKVVKE